MGKLKRVKGGWSHWCPACERFHLLPDAWPFNGNQERPTFEGSFLHRGSNDLRCHYVVTDGVLLFGHDCAHAMLNTNVPMPEFPERPTAQPEGNGK